jgi:hypothetical protein
MTSKVLYLDHIPASWTEETLKRAFIAHSEPKKIVLLRKRNALFAGYNPTSFETVKNSIIQALVEMPDVETASRLLEAFQQTPLQAEGKIITISYSKNHELRDRNLFTKSKYRYGTSDDGYSGKANRILLVTVQNPTYPITTDLIYEIFGSYGAVEKAVIFVKPVGLQVIY